MEQSIKDNTKKAKSMELENLSGQMVQNTMVNSLTTTFMDQASMNGLMADGTTVPGLITRCTARVYSHGKTAESTKENTKMTRRMAMARFHGLTDEDTSGTGDLESNTVKERTLLQKGKKNTENGKTVKESDGLPLESNKF